MSIEATIARELDLRGLNCPLPVLKTRKALIGLAPGTRIALETTDPVSVIDIPHFCREDGHTLISREDLGTAYRFVIEKGGLR